MATLAVASRPISRHSSTNRAHTLRMRRAVVLAEIGDRLVVGHKPAQQPHHLEIAPGLALQPPARLHAVEIAVDVELQQSRRMIGGPAGRRRLNTVEPELGQIERIDERVDHANRIVLVDPVIEAFGQQASTARDPPPQRSASSITPANHQGNHNQRRRFHTARVKTCRSGGCGCTAVEQPIAAELGLRLDRGMCARSRRGVAPRVMARLSIPSAIAIADGYQSRTTSGPYEGSMIRIARTGDVARIREIARAAYARYVPRIGREPAPMVATMMPMCAPDGS